MPSVGSSKLLVTRTCFRLQVREVAGAIGQKMPAELDAALAKVASSIDVAGLESELAAYENEPAVQSLRDLAAQWAGGAAGVAADAVADLLDRFLAVEEKFVGRADEDAATRELIKASSKKDAADVLLAPRQAQGEIRLSAGVSGCRASSPSFIRESYRRRKS